MKEPNDFHVMFDSKRKRNMSVFEKNLIPFSLTGYSVLMPGLSNEYQELEDIQVKSCGFFDSNIELVEGVEDVAKQISLLEPKHRVHNSSLAKFLANSGSGLSYIHADYQTKINKDTFNDLERIIGRMNCVDSWIRITLVKTENRSKYEDAVFSAYEYQINKLVALHNNLQQLSDYNGCVLDALTQLENRLSGFPTVWSFIYNCLLVDNRYIAVRPVFLVDEYKSGTRTLKMETYAFHCYSVPKSSYLEHLKQNMSLVVKYSLQGYSHLELEEITKQKIKEIV